MKLLSFSNIIMHIYSAITGMLEPWELMVEDMKFTTFIGSAYHCCTSDHFQRVVIEFMGLV